MSEIPQTALDRLARLRRMLDVARAQADGMQSRVDEARRQLEHASFDLQMSTRGHQWAVIAGEGGLAYEERRRERTVNDDLRGAQHVTAHTSELARAPAFDGVTVPLARAKEKLAEALTTRREALERAAELRGATDKVEQELRRRFGWCESLPTGEGLLRDARGPVVVNAVSEMPR